MTDEDGLHRIYRLGGQIPTAPFSKDAFSLLMRQVGIGWRLIHGLLQQRRHVFGIVIGDQRVPRFLEFITGHGILGRLMVRP